MLCVAESWESVEGEALPEVLVEGAAEVNALSPFDPAVFPTEPVKSALGWVWESEEVLLLPGPPGSLFPAGLAVPEPDEASLQVYVCE